MGQSIMDKERIGKLISNKRKELGLTQKQLAEKLFVSDKAVSNWETGKGYPDIQTIPLLIEVLGIEISKFITDYTNITVNDKEVEGKNEDKTKSFIKKKSTIIFLMLPVIFLIFFGLAAVLSEATLYLSANSDLEKIGRENLLIDYFIGWILTSTFFGVLPLVISFIRDRWAIISE